MPAVWTGPVPVFNDSAPITNEQIEYLVAIGNLTEKNYLWEKIDAFFADKILFGLATIFTVVGVYFFCVCSYSFGKCMRIKTRAQRQKARENTPEAMAVAAERKKRRRLKFLRDQAARMSKDSDDEFFQENVSFGGEPEELNDGTWDEGKILRRFKQRGKHNPRTRKRTPWWGPNYFKKVLDVYKDYDVPEKMHLVRQEEEDNADRINYDSDQEYWKDEYEGYYEQQQSLQMQMHQWYAGYYAQQGAPEEKPQPKKAQKEEKAKDVKKAAAAPADAKEKLPPIKGADKRAPATYDAKGDVLW